LVATQSSGGHGLTLNEAKHHIFYSNGFKYSERSQAEDRSYRIGQTKPVTYIDIVCSGSIDDRIDEALGRKANALHVFRQKIEQIKDKRSAEIRKLVAGL
jgi:SNF2 family DNA or RNA helicase